MSRFEILCVTMHQRDFSKLKEMNVHSDNVPVGVEEFLSERFGDYMKIPDIQQIRREQHASVWDTEKDYKEYVTKEPLFPRKYVI